MGEGQAVEPSSGLANVVGVGELSLDDAVLMATVSLAHHNCWVGVGNALFTRRNTLSGGCPPWLACAPSGMSPALSRCYGAAVSQDLT